MKEMIEEQIDTTLEEILCRKLTKAKLSLLNIREELNKMDEPHLAGELSAVCIILDSLDQALWEKAFIKKQ